MGLFSGLKKIGKKIARTAIKTLVPGGGAILAGVDAIGPVLKGRGGQRMTVNTQTGQVGVKKLPANLGGALPVPIQGAGGFLDKQVGLGGLTIGQQIGAGLDIAGGLPGIPPGLGTIFNRFTSGGGGAVAPPGTPPVSNFVPGFGFVPPGVAMKPMTRMTNKAPAGFVLVTRTDPQSRMPITLAVEKSYARKNYGYKNPAKPLISVRQTQALRRSASAMNKLKREAGKFYRVTKK